MELTQSCNLFRSSEWEYSARCTVLLFLSYSHATPLPQGCCWLSTLDLNCQSFQLAQINHPGFCIPVKYISLLFFSLFLKQHLNIERITEALCPSVKLQPGMLQSILLHTTVYVCYPTITISRGHKRGMTPLEIPSLLSPSTCWRSLWPEAQLGVPQMQCLRGGLTLQLQIDLLTSQSISTIDKACQEHDNHYFPEKVQFKQVGPKSSTPSTIKQLTWLAHHSPLWLQCKPFPNERQQFIKFPSYDADCPGRAKVDAILTWKYIPGLQLLSTFCNSLPNNTICALALGGVQWFMQGAGHERQILALKWHLLHAREWK